MLFILINSAHSTKDGDSYSSRSEERSPEDRPWRSRSPIGSRRHREYDSERVKRDCRAERIKGDERVKSDDREERDERVRRRSPGVAGRRGGGRRGKKGHAPSYVVNPAKWKKYDLSTDGSEDLVREGFMEDEVNRHAAFEFLKEARERRERERNEEMEKEGGEVGGVGAGKVVFRKPSQSSSSSRRGGRGAGRKEVVGQGRDGDEECVRVGGTRKRRGELGSMGRKGTLSGVSLSHLAEEEEEGD